MAGLFSLGGRGGRGSNSEEEQQNATTEIPPPDSLFWYSKNDDVVSSYRGFELWNQNQQQQLMSQSQPRPLFQQDLYSSATALGVGPSRPADDHSPSRSAFMMSSGSGSGGITCQDCGNQAKKDCPHMRCRTCCKSRGFDCQTHVKSTWVPAARRRERQQQQVASGSGGGDVPKRQRDHNQTSSSLACTRLPTTNPSPSGSEEVDFPSVVNSLAEFRCVRVSSVDESEEEYAYSTAVNIGGHVFKGILYDYGPDGTAAAAAGNSSSTGGAEHLQHLNLIQGTPATAVGTIVDPSSLYPAPLNTCMPAVSGTQFFPHPRS